MSRKSKVVIRWADVPPAIVVGQIFRHRQRMLNAYYSNEYTPIQKERIMAELIYVDSWLSRYTDIIEKYISNFTVADMKRMDLYYKDRPMEFIC